MAKTNSTKSNRVDPIRPFYAAVGGVDLAVAVARNGLSEAQTRLAKVDLAPKAIPSHLESLVNDYVAEINETVDDLNKQYVGLAARGRTLVNRIRRQQATQDLQASARNTTSRAKATTTQTKKSASTAAKSASDAARSTARSASTAARSTAKTASTAKGSAKATGTSARKTATAAKRATQDAAAKTGA